MSSILDDQNNRPIATQTTNASASSSSSSSKISFEDLLATADLPPPGQEYYAARRALWLQAPPNYTSKPRVPESEESPTRRRLHTLLNGPDPAHSDRMWAGVAKVWSGLNDGSRLKKPLPLPMLVRNISYLISRVLIIVYFTGQNHLLCMAAR